MKTHPTLNSLNTKMGKGLNKAFTLVEILIAIAIIAIITAFVVPAMFNSKADATQKSAEARAKVLNEARDRAIIVGITSEEEWTTTFGSSAESTNAIMFLLTNNLIRYSIETTNN